MTDRVTISREEYDSLLAKISRLETQLRFLGQHKTLALGMAGEQLIARLSGGITTAHTSRHDIEMLAGQKIEVKTSKISVPMVKKPNSGKRWQWHKIYGQDGQKIYDWLVLVGQADPRYKEFYLDRHSEYVMFLIPYDQLKNYITSGNMIVLSSNPITASGRSAGMFSEHQILADDLRGMVESA
jgi:hypothetical protein